MKYAEVVEWLFNQVPNFQKKGEEAYKPGLEKISSLLSAIHDPHKEIKTIHIAGTNGKGSVSHILAAIFQLHGYKVGLFTSPHIVDFRERIKINGEPISKAFVIDFITDLKPFIDQNQPSFFELTTAMAFKAFNFYACDISIIETGLGGRLDATNVIDPELSIITNIGMDHTQFLGNTLEKIAAEKAGIIKYGKPVVIGDLDPNLNTVFDAIAAEKKASIYFSSSKQTREIATDLIGRYQQRNLKTALCAVDLLQEEWKLSEDKTDEAVRRVKETTNFKGRLELINKKPLTLIDAGHNADGIKNLMEEVLQMKFDCLHILYGASNDKNLNEIATFFPKQANYYFTAFNSKRSTTIEQFEEVGKKYNLNYRTFVKPKNAFECCKSEASEKDLILVCGSFYLMEEII